MKYVFILYDYVTASMQMRGITVVNALKEAGVDARCITNDQINDVNWDDAIGIIIKVPYKDTIAHLRKKGAKIVFDIIDKFNWDQLLKLDYDCVIAANNLHKEQISKWFNKQIIVIPHLHTNVARKRKSISQLKTVGYIGQAIQFPITKEMATYCKGKGLSWFQAGGDKAKTVEQETMALDLGVIYIDKLIEQNGLNFDFVTKYKPATKLTNMFSYGIPALFSPTASFLEAIEPDPSLKFLIVNSKDDIFNKIDNLISDNDLYVDLSKRCIAISEIYHMDRAVKYYRKLECQ